MVDFGKFVGKKGNLLFLLVILFVFSVFLHFMFFTGPPVLFSPGSEVGKYEGVIFIFIVLVVIVSVILFLQHKKKI